MTTSIDISALVAAAFRSLPQAARTPRDLWTPVVTPVLPVGWPAEQFVYYAYAHRSGGRVDAYEVSEPWARIEAGPEPVLMPLSQELKSLGVDCLRPATVGERMLFDEVKNAGSLEDLCRAAGREDRVALLVRRSYCHWRSQNRIATTVLRWHPAFAGFLDCMNLKPVTEPAPRSRPLALFASEFNRRWPMTKGHPHIWQLAITEGFPLEWPVGQKTRLAYYAFAIRVDRTSTVPCPREVTEPWGMVVRDGHDGALAFTSLTTVPKSLGVQPGKSLPDSYWQLLTKIRAVLDARYQSDIDELLMPAADDSELGALARSFYQLWIEDESSIAAWVMPRHAAFAAFVAGSERKHDGDSVGNQSRRSTLAGRSDDNCDGGSVKGARMRSRTLAWYFKSDFTLREARNKLFALQPGKWMDRDSHYKPDSVSGALPSGGSARLFQNGSGDFVVNLSVESEEHDFEVTLQKAKDELFAGVLSVLAAIDAVECEPVE